MKFPVRPWDRWLQRPFPGRYFAAASLITFSAVLVYSNTFHGPFLFDDLDYIVNNPVIRNPGNFLDISGTRYVAHLSFALNYRIGGYNPLGYHLVNTAIHIINGLLVLSLVTLTFKTPQMERCNISPAIKTLFALTPALIFITHPVETQAVTYITQRFASLATLFYLLSLVLFVMWRVSRENPGQGGRTAFYVLSLASAVLAMKTKEISFTLPLVLVMYELFFFNERSFKERIYPLVPFFLILLIIPLSLFLPELGLAEERTTGIAEKIRQRQIEELVTLSPYQYLVTQFRVIVTYIRLLLLPVNQNVDYDYPVYSSFFEPGVFLSFIFLLSFVFLAVYLFARSRRTGNVYALLASFGIIWFFLTLSVESGVIPIKDVIFEHRLYLPGVGAVIAFSSAAFYVFGLLEPKVSPLVAACVLLVVTSLPLGVAAHQRNYVWGDGVTFWEDVVKKSPGKARGHNNLGEAYNNRGLVDEAIEELEIALELKPGYAEAHTNLGIAYTKKGLLDEAEVEHLEALKIIPDYAVAHNNLGIVYAGKGELDRAVKEYKTALRLMPEDPEIHNNLGVAYASQGRTSEAMEEFKKAIRLVPHNINARYNLALAYRDKGLKEESIRELEEVLRIRPDDAKARKALESLSGH